MGRLVVLDSTPLHLLTTREGNALGDRCRAWMESIQSENEVAVPVVAEYEVRRELVRRRASARLRHLDRLMTRLVLLDVNRNTLLLAAELWARVRNLGMPTASDDSLDADCIIAAQALLAAGGGPMIVATGNPSHLSRFCDADEWHAITRPGEEP